MNMNNTDMQATADVLSFSLILLSLTELLPPIAAILSIVWIGIRIVETCTVRSWIAKVRGQPFSWTDCLGDGGD